MYLIIDGSSMLSTNYYGTLPFSVLTAKTDEEKAKHFKEIMQTKDGVYTNGVFSSLRNILNIINDQQPEGIAVCLDASRDTFRRELYSDYKAQRGGTPSPLKEQFNTFNKILNEIGIPTFYSTRFEADDLAGSLARKIESLGGTCAVMSADKDYYQLVTSNTKFWRIIPSPAQPKYKKLYGINFSQYVKDNNLPKGVFEITEDTGIIADKEIIHLTPEQFIDYLSVVGDKVDNIPGVQSVGPKSIVPLLQEYGTLSDIYSAIQEAMDEGTMKQLADDFKEIGVKKSTINALMDHKDEADLSRLLAQINCSCPVPNDLESYKLNINKDGLAEVINRYEFKSLEKFIDEEMELERE
mgnify:CR=1 FL=1